MYRFAITLFNLSYAAIAVGFAFVTLYTLSAVFFALFGSHS